jgi:putative addiction module antidote
MAYGGIPMTSETKIIAIGDSLGIILPVQQRRRLAVEFGDSLIVTETPGGVVLKPMETEKMRAIRDVMHEHRDVLKRLADS